MEQFLIELASKYTVIVGICTVLGVFRLVFKPLFALWKAITEITPSTKDDEMYAKTVASKIYKGALWLADYLFSVKLPGVKTPEAK